ncbi:hypothetical protein ACMHYC_18390 [Acinetobacter courvalinii]|jgi:hypothetical protein|uniref:hypothetical protein n=1 Tax=Acinetobacter courvalinii TaxID=280147 RepID=UPI0039C9563E
MNTTLKQKNFSFKAIVILATSVIFIGLAVKFYMDVLNAKALIEKNITETVAIEKAKIPYQVNPDLNLVNIKQDKLHLTYTYQTIYKTVNEIDVQHPEKYYTLAQQTDNCEFYRAYVVLGVVIDYKYIDKNGKSLFTKSVDKATCKL